ncbi:MAG: hypothetical protein QOJ35_57 [Solirubrobacteraceae bacterium]|jgi:hypothetical protein|nr:hypothetical protein [Solirubrobacteraceae bacterium]
MGLLSREVRKQARELGVSYSFLFMQPNGGQPRELASRRAAMAAGQRCRPFARTRLLRARAAPVVGARAGAVRRAMPTSARRLARRR